MVSSPRLPGRHTPALLILLYFVLAASAYAAATPIFEAPDEAAHFLYIHNLLKTGELPVLEGRAETFASGSTQRHHPPLYYLAGAVLIAGTDRSDLLEYLIFNPLASLGTVSPNNQNAYLHNSPPPPPGQTPLAVAILRAYSIALAAGTLWLVYRSGELAFEDRRTGLLAMLLAASIPSFVFISASVNNDNLVTFLFAAGVWWSLRLWQRRAVTAADSLILGAILGAAALTKLNGAVLFPVVYLFALVGAARGLYPWRQAAQLIALSLAMAALVAGWWYARNVQLYGDPLAMQATLAVWSRGTPPATLEAALSEAEGVWRSFWMVLGQFNVGGPGWLYPYAAVAVAAAGLGVARNLAARPRPTVGVLLFACAAVIAALIAATQWINVSQGRILFPMLAGFTPLAAHGWLALLGRRLGILPVLPLIAVTLAAPLTALPDAYAPLERVEAVPPSAVPLDLHAESLALLGYELREAAAAPGSEVRLWVYFRGQHAEAPVLFVQALNPVTQVPLGGADLYPGMVSTSRLDPAAIYRAPVAFRLEAISAPCPPCRLDLTLGWRVLETDRYLPLTTGVGGPADFPRLPGPVVTARDTALPEPAKAAGVTFGEAIRLEGYTLGVTELAAGETLDVSLYWQALIEPGRDWTLAFGLLDGQGQVAAQADGPPAAYPTSAWIAGVPFVDERALPLPPGLRLGTYRLYVGWYDPAQGDHLPARGEGTAGDLFFLPEPVVVR